MQQKSGMGCLKVIGLMLLTILITLGVSYWLFTSYLFPKQFEPVALSEKEDVALSQKLAQFGIQVDSPTTTPLEKNTATGEVVGGVLQPEVYSEVGAKREVEFSERELNAMLAKNTELADKLAIDLSDNLASAKLLLPLEEDFPFFGGKTLKASAGLEIAYENERPVVVLKGVSVWGVPIPNAWLGGVKNVDMVKEFGADEGFWKSFADGVDNIRVTDGLLVIKLKE